LFELAVQFIVLGQALAQQDFELADMAKRDGFDARLLGVSRAPPVKENDRLRTTIACLRTEPTNTQNHYVGPIDAAEAFIREELRSHAR
jgi:hypothetical protein